MAYKTEHPKLVIIRKSGFDFIYKKSFKKQQQMDMFTYFNSKFVFIERNIRGDGRNLMDFGRLLKINRTGNQFFKIPTYRAFGTFKKVLFEKVVTLK